MDIVITMMSSNGHISALLAICAGNSTATGEFPSQWPVTRNFDVVFDLQLKKRLSKQSRSWWFETPSPSLWSHCNGYIRFGYWYNRCYCTIGKTYKWNKFELNQRKFIPQRASSQIRIIAGCACAGNAGNVFPPPRVSDPDMDHGTCVTHVPRCISGSLTSGFL